MNGTAMGADQDMADCGGRLDAQLAHLIETVWACERAARREDRLDAVIALAATERPRRG